MVREHHGLERAQSFGGLNEIEFEKLAFVKHAPPFNILDVKKHMLSFVFQPRIAAFFVGRHRACYPVVCRRHAMSPTFGSGTSHCSAILVMARFCSSSASSTVCHKSSSRRDSISSTITACKSAGGSASISQAPGSSPRSSKCAKYFLARGSVFFTGSDGSGFPSP